MPMASPATLSAVSSSGVHQRATGRWCEVGRRYWPMVTMSTPTPARSARVCSISSAVSPIPAISEDFVVRPAALARASTASERA